MPDGKRPAKAKVKTILARRVLWKLPGTEAVERRISTREPEIRKLIGCTFETRAFWTEDGWSQTVLLCAHQATARALGFPEHIWIPTGVILGPIVAINRNWKGEYLDLSDADIDQWQVRLQEFEIALNTEYAHQAIAADDEKARRREHSGFLAVEQDDDLTAVLRMHVEIEQRVRERTLERLPYPDRLGRRMRLELPEALAVAGALDAIPLQLVKLIESLGQIRNRFAHEPGYIATPDDVNRLKKLAEAAGLEDTRWAFDQRVLETVHMSEESRDLRMVFDRVILELDKDVQDERRAEEAVKPVTERIRRP